MGLRANPTQRQRRLGVELRRLREAAGMSATEAATFADLSSPHLGHIEAARTATPEAKLRALAAAYGCQQEPLVEALVAMSNATGKGWWSTYKKALDSRVLDLAELEATASVHRTFDWLYVPGLLQTEEYMRALFNSGHPVADSRTLDTYAEFRLSRQQVLDVDKPPTLHAVIHEAAFHMCFVDTAIMRRQLTHLIEMAKLPHVHIQILPFKATTYPDAMGAPFVLLESAVPELSTVYIEHPVSALFLDDPPQLAQYNAAFESLSSSALAPLAACPERVTYAKTESLGLVQHLLYVL
ncbi:helix-turn-helix domain-containing protein [Streptomyces piniterrae]|uniref:Helix-turn-helix domain-containing protein n=1 Tax=Streptomyces piniterrae TaxID=2571125 RepID=A0A4U0NF73_9ACTN|nr:helix-turn-helix transcriptional regulator [Streptomyces piniterrae]TJZ52755.1 helix-turn-helix domain-containing protein [Streptomyces piniterrae]